MNATHFRLRFDDGSWLGYYATREEAGRAAEVHREHGDAPEVVELAGRYEPPTEYGEAGTVDGVPVRNYRRSL